MSAVYDATFTAGGPGIDDVLVSATGPVVTAALRDAAPRHVIDLSGRLGPSIEELPGYSGVGW